LKTKDTLKSSLKEFGISYLNSQLASAEDYLDIVYEYNDKFSLTGTKDKEGILIRHILDSLSILKHRKKVFSGLSENERILDVGTGAGLPGIPLAIFLADKDFYLLDVSMKKTDFLDKVIKELNITNVTVVRRRAEKAAREEIYRENFDIVMSRAVARFNILSELTIPFSRINGKIVLYKSIKVEDELAEGKEAILKLGGKVDSLLEVKVPYLNEYRSFLLLKKIKESPVIYPRSFNKIKKKPL
jgi:16S rRNA (guanine527-N7)-methyltransferase